MGFYTWGSRLHILTCSLCVFVLCSGVGCGASGSLLRERPRVSHFWASRVIGPMATRSPDSVILSPLNHCVKDICKTVFFLRPMRSYALLLLLRHVILCSAWFSHATLLRTGTSCCPSCPTSGQNAGCPRLSGIGKSSPG
jgi:hypothetical protein